VRFFSAQNRQPEQYINVTTGQQQIRMDLVHHFYQNGHLPFHLSSKETLCKKITTVFQ